jgi:hypothetical protein
LVKAALVKGLAFNAGILPLVAGKHCLVTALDLTLILFKKLLAIARLLHENAKQSIHVEEV